MTPIQEKNVKICLLEAARRVALFGGDSPNYDYDFWVLAFPSDAKDAVRFDFLKPSFKVHPRAKNWYKLTAKGAKVIQKWALKQKDFDGFDYVGNIDLLSLK